MQASRGSRLIRHAEIQEVETDERRDEKRELKKTTESLMEHQVATSLAQRRSSFSETPADDFLDR